MLMIVAATLVGCNSNQEKKTSEAAVTEEPKAIAIKACTAESMTVDLKETYTSEILPYKENDITPAAQGLHIDEIKVDVFAEGDRVDVTGTSKGHGYQGVVKRHGAAIKRMTHGGGPVHRHQGSLGSGTDPSRIFKGRDGAGHMGVEQVTVQNLTVVKVDPELNMLVVCGAIPGPKGGLVTVKSTVKTHKVKQAGADISKNPQKASGRNPQKASARNK